MVFGESFTYEVNVCKGSCRGGVFSHCHEDGLPSGVSLKPPPGRCIALRKGLEKNEENITV